VKINPRLLSAPERALIIRLLEHAGKAQPPLTDLDDLRVVGTCDCGCGTIDLEPISTEAPTDRPGILADAYGTVQAGHGVGLILWGTAANVSSLEIYSLAFDPPFELPSPDSVSDIYAESDPAV
jgi:hypothetical protein